MLVTQVLVGEHVNVFESREQLVLGPARAGRLCRLRGELPGSRKGPGLASSRVIVPTDVRLFSAPDVKSVAVRVNSSQVARVSRCGRGRRVRAAH